MKTILQTLLGKLWSTRLQNRSLRRQLVHEPAHDMREEMQEACFELDTDWRFTYVNSAFVRISGGDRSRYLGNVIWDIFPGSRESDFYVKYATTMQERVHTEFEEYSPRIGRWLRVSVYPAPAGIVIYGQDVTLQHETARRLQDTQRDLQTLIDSTADGIWYLGPHYTVLYGNKASQTLMQKMAGHALPAALHYNLGEALPVHFWETLKPGLDQAYQGVTNTLSHNFQDEGGTDHHYQILLTPVWDADHDRIVGVGCFARNVTLDRLSARRISAQNDRLRQIAWSQSHLVRGPVAGILGLVKLFNHHRPDDPFNAEVLHYINTLARELDSAVHDIVKEASEPVR